MSLCFGKVLFGVCVPFVLWFIRHCQGGFQDSNNVLFKILLKREKDTEKSLQMFLFLRPRELGEKAMFTVKFA